MGRRGSCDSRGRPTCSGYIRGRPGHPLCESYAARLRRGPSPSLDPGAIGFSLRYSIRSALRVLGGGQVIAAAVEPQDIGLLGLAQALRCLGNRVEHRLDVRGRAGDDVEHIAGRGLILERFGQLPACAPAPRRTGARSRSRSPPGRRRSSTSSICWSVNGRTVERVRHDHPDRSRLRAAAARRAWCGSARLSAPRIHCVFGIGEHVGDVDRLGPRKTRPPDQRPASRRDLLARRTR